MDFQQIPLNWEMIPAEFQHYQHRLMWGLLPNIYSRTLPLIPKLQKAMAFDKTPDCGDGFHFSLTIGTWQYHDVYFFYTDFNSSIHYVLEPEGNMIEYQLHNIEDISIGEGTPSRLVVELRQPPKFLMDTEGWRESGDITENQQASQVLSHQIEGCPKGLFRFLFMYSDPEVNKHCQRRGENMEGGKE